MIAGPSPSTYFWGAVTNAGSRRGGGAHEAHVKGAAAPGPRSPRYRQRPALNGDRLRSSFLAGGFTEPPPRSQGSFAMLVGRDCRRAVGDFVPIGLTL